jgi:hypothetical protein
MQRIKWLLLIFLLFMSRFSYAVLPTEADYAALKQDITVTNQAEFATAVSTNNDAVIVAAYNAIPSPSFWVWRTSLSEKEIYEATADGGGTWNWATYKAQTVQDRDSWARMFAPGVVNPSLPNTRAGWTAIFGGAGASLTQVNYLLALSRRTARRIEALLIVPASGNGSTATPSNMRYEGMLTVPDVAHALRGTPLP